MYNNGKGVKQDYPEAVRWFQKAAEQGNASAQNNLGSMHGCGQGVNQDYSEAARWYQKAAEQGHASAQSNLGIMHYSGQGVKQDYSEAARWLQKAAEQGNDEAAGILRDLLQKQHQKIKSQTAGITSKKEKGASALEAKECANCLAPEGQHGVAFKVCIRCKAIRYCGRACQTAHWKACHKQLCVSSEKKQWPPKPPQSSSPPCEGAPPGDVTKPQPAGMTSKKDKGASAPEAKECANCLAPEGQHGVTLKACIRCKATHYCGRACQTAHWKAGHKKFCVTPEERVPPKPLLSPASSQSDRAPAGDITECAICLDPLDLAATCMLPCSHTFHAACVDGLRSFGLKQVCPLCRTEV